MPEKDYELIKPSSFSGEEMAGIIEITRSRISSRRHHISMDQEKCDAIFLFIEKVIKKIRKIDRPFIVRSIQKVVLEKTAGGKIQFRINFKSSNETSVSVRLIPEKEARKKR